MLLFRLTSRLGFRLTARLVTPVLPALPVSSPLALSLPTVSSRLLKLAESPAPAVFDDDDGSSCMPSWYSRRCRNGGGVRGCDCNALATAKGEGGTLTLLAVEVLPKLSEAVLDLLPPPIIEEADDDVVTPPALK